MRNLPYSLSAALTLTVASILTANAHSSLENASSPLGYYKAVVKIPHGCEGQATNSVRIQIPEGYVGVKPMPKAGWTLVIEKGDYAKAYEMHGKDVSSGVKTVTWIDGDLPDDYYDEFVLSGTLAELEQGAKLAFITTQTCKDSTVSWNEIAKDGQDPHALKFPAPVLEIVADEAMDSGDHAAHMAQMEAQRPATTSSEATTVGALKISDAWTRAMLPGQPVGGGYLTIENTGPQADRLVSATSDVTPDLQIHEMKMEGEIMKMRQLVEGLELPAGARIELKPGGYHLMFMKMTSPFKQGDKVKIKLKFEKAGEVELGLPVLPANTSAAK
jgi:periplasmic copper chaperone A